MTGAQIGYKLNSKTKVEFADAGINPFTSFVQSAVEQPTNFLSTIYGGAGFELHKSSWPMVSATLIVPSLPITDHSGLANPIMGVGVHLSVQLPFKKSK